MKYYCYLLSKNIVNDLEVYALVINYRMTDDCPLNPLITIRSLSFKSAMWRLPQLIEIEKHVSSGSCLHPPLRDLILDEPLKGSTPLLVACQQGYLEAVKRMVDHWGVDIQATAKYYRYIKEGNECNKLLIQNATSLFVAALNCQVEIVQYLIEKGADL